MTLFALWRGRRWVRVFALLNAANWAINLVAQPPPARAADVFPWGNFTVDAAFAAVFVALATRERRPWAALFAAFMLLGVADYVSYLLDDRLVHRALVTANYLWAAGALLCLLYATVRPRPPAD